jgi:hypothetical protein
MASEHSETRGSMLQFKQTKWEVCACSETRGSMLQFKQTKWEVCACVCWCEAAEVTDLPFLSNRLSKGLESCLEQRASELTRTHTIAAVRKS